MEEGDVCHLIYRFKYVICSYYQSGSVHWCGHCATTGHVLRM